MRLKRLISAFIACAMLVTFMPMQAFAAPDDELYEVSQSQQDNSTVLNNRSESDVEDDISTQQVNYQLEKTVGWSEKIECGKWSNLAWETDDYWTNSDYRVVQLTDYHPIIGTVQFNAISPGTTTIILYKDKEHTKVRYQWEITVEEDNNKSTDRSRESFEFSKDSSNVEVAYAYKVDEDVASDLYPLQRGETICLPGKAKDYPIAFYVKATKGYVPESTFQCAGSANQYSPIGTNSNLAQSNQAKEKGYTEEFYFEGNTLLGNKHREFTIKAVPVKVSVKYSSGNTSDNVSGMPVEDNTTYTHEDVDDSVYQHEIVLPSQEPSREGYTFKGWKLESDGITLNAKGPYQHDDEITLDDNTWDSATKEQATITFVAQWEKDEEPVKSTNGYFYVLKPGEQNPGTTDPQHFYYVGRGSLQETPQEMTDVNDGVASQIQTYPNAEQLQAIGAGAIANKVGANFENVFWYRVSQAAGANSNVATPVVPDGTTTWHVDGILKPKNPNYQVRFILKQEETEPVLNVYDIPSGTPISNQNIQSAADNALQIGNPGEGYVVRWKDAKGQVVTDEQIIAATKGAQAEEVLVFYAEFVQPAMPTVQEALADYKKTVTAPESVKTFQLTVFKFELKKLDASGNWVEVPKLKDKLLTVPVSQPVEDLMIAGTNDYLQPGTYHLTEIQTEEELKHWAKNNQQFTFTVTNDGKIVRTSEETVFENTYLVPKLSVTKQLSEVNDQPYTQGAMVSVGDTLTYTVAVENTGNVDLNNVTVTDTFTGSGAPTTSTEGVTWEQVPDGSSYNATWSIGALNQSIKATMTYTYTVTDADKGKTITNTAVAGSNEITEDKPEATISVTVATDNQITVNYYSNNENYGTVSAEAANKVFTFTEEEIAAAKTNGGKLPVRKLHAQATETSDGDFDRWTSSDFGTLFPVYRATLDVDVTFTVDQLGKTLEVVANFDRETGGGGAHHPDARDDDDDDNDRDDDDEEEIIDEEVPLAETPWLNTEDHYAYIIGYSEDGTVRPNANISRAEVATIFFRLLTDEARDQFWMTTNNFSDVLPNDWYNNAVSTMVNMGIIQGYEDGTFRPNANITRAEFAAIAARFMASGYGVEDDLFTDIANHWARESINDAAMAGWINGYEDGTFRPDAAITRAEAVTLVNNVLQRKPDADHMFDSMIKWPDNPESAWYYEAIQEATNSHDYDLFEDAEYETWTALQENRDWAALEKDWVNTHRTGGEVA